MIPLAALHFSAIYATGSGQLYHLNMSLNWQEDKLSHRLTSPTIVLVSVTEVQHGPIKLHRFSTFRKYKAVLIALLIGFVIGIGTGWLLHQRQVYPSLRWWEAHRLKQLHEQAEQLRNGPLQDLFGLRRHLELLLTTHGLVNDAAGQELLAQLKLASSQLEHGSDRLSSPFDLATDSASLPLALRTILEPTGDSSKTSGDASANHPEVQVNLNLPQQWKHEASLGSLLLPTVVEQLTQHYWQNRQGTDGEQSMGIDAQLISKQHQAQFCLQLRPPLDSMLLTPKDAIQLRQVFQYLSGGRCQFNRSDGAEIWSFTWS